jgi:hypothetical protein
VAIAASVVISAHALLFILLPFIAVVSVMTAWPRCKYIKLMPDNSFKR